jgi:nucleotide-binding universal stress UspA family protein
MRPKRVLVPVDGSTADKEAIRLSCRLAKRAGGKVRVADVIQVERNLPLDAPAKSEVDKGEEILDQAERVGEEEDCNVETDLLHAREVGPAIVDEAIERGVDLITIGLTHREEFGEFSLGSTLPYILKNAPCRVLICREPISEEED